MHRQLPDLLGMGIFYLLDELRLIHIVEHQIPLFCAHYQILIPRQYYKAQYIHLLNILLQNYLKSFLIGVELNLPNVDGVKAVSDHKVIVVGNHHPPDRPLVAPDRRAYLFRELELLFFILGGHIVFVTEDLVCVRHRKHDLDLLF